MRVRKAGCFRSSRSDQAGQVGRARRSERELKMEYCRSQRMPWVVRMSVNVQCTDGRSDTCEQNALAMLRGASGDNSASFRRRLLVDVVVEMQGRSAGQACSTLLSSESVIQR